MNEDDGLWQYYQGLTSQCYLGEERVMPSHSKLDPISSESRKKSGLKLLKFDVVTCCTILYKKVSDF